MILLSWALLIVEPISAVMVLALVLRFRRCMGIHFLARLWCTGLVVGLCVHAAGQLELILDYRPPRTLTWIISTLSINGLIWTAYLTDLRRRHRAAQARA
jgi:hypothetical protein